MTLRSALATFLPNRLNRRLFPAFACFAVGILGGVVGFIADAYQLRTLGQLAFVVVALAVAVGCASVLWLFVTFFTNKQ
jgi:hypothetical protein